MNNSTIFANSKLLVSAAPELIWNCRIELLAFRGFSAYATLDAATAMLACIHDMVTLPCNGD